MRKLFALLNLLVFVLTANAQVLVNPFNYKPAPATPTYVGKGTSAAGTGNVTPTLPGSLATNDLMVLEAETNGETVTAPAGWTEFSFSPYNNTSNITRLTLFYRRYVSGDGNPTITDPGDHCIAQVYAFRGVTVTGDGSSMHTNSGFSSTTAFTIPQGTTTDPNQLVALFIADGADVATNRFVGLGTNASLTSLNQRESISSNLGDGGGLNLYTGIKATAGSCGDLTGTLGTGTGFACISIAFTATPTITTPVNTLLPAITGTPTVGAVLTCSTGSWTSIGSTSYTYQWEKDGVDIGGETSTTYTVVSGDNNHNIGCDVIATNASGASPEAAASTVYVSTITNSEITSNHFYSGSDRMLVYVPPGYYSNSNDYPVILFYPGNGQRSVSVDTYDAIGTGNGSTTNFSGSLTNSNTNTGKIIHSSAYVTVSGLIVATGHLGTFTGTGVTGTYDYDDGTSAAYSVTFTTPPASSAPIRIYYTKSDLLTQGTFRYLNLGDTPPDVIIACPQISRTDGGYENTEWDNALNYLTTNFRVNTDRIYVTGLSLGGDMCNWVFIDGNGNPGSNYSFAAFVSASPGSNSNVPAGSSDAYVNSDNKGKLYVRGTNEGTGVGDTKVPSMMANANTKDLEFPIQQILYWGGTHGSSGWDNHVYNRKNRTDATGVAEFDYIDWLMRFSLDAEEQATLFVRYCEDTDLIEDYRLAKRQVDNLTAGATKTTLLADLVTQRALIGRVALIDFGTAFYSTSTTGYNNITSAAAGTSISGLVDDTGASTSWNYTTTAATAATPTMLNDLGSLRVNGRQWGFTDLDTNRDGMLIDAAGTTGTFTFTGLNNAKTYTLRFYVAASSSSYSARAEVAAVMGGVTKTLYCDNQNFRYIEYTGRAPSGGVLTATLAQNLTTSTERNAYLQVIEFIEEL